MEEEQQANSSEEAQTSAAGVDLEGKNVYQCPNCLQEYRHHPEIEPGKCLICGAELAQKVEKTL